MKDNEGTLQTEMRISQERHFGAAGWQVLQHLLYETNLHHALYVIASYLIS